VTSLESDAAASQKDAESRRIDSPWMPAATSRLRAVAITLSWKLPDIAYFIVHGVLGAMRLGVREIVVVGWEAALEVLGILKAAGSKFAGANFG
jgi:hypothetical protein